MKFMNCKLFKTLNIRAVPNVAFFGMVTLRDLFVASLLRDQPNDRGIKLGQASPKRSPKVVATGCFAPRKKGVEGVAIKSGLSGQWWFVCFVHPEIWGNDAI